MQKKSEDFSVQEALRLAKSPVGQQLLAALQQTDASAVNTAAKQAKSGDMEQAKQTLSSLLSSPQIQELMRQLGR